MRYSLKMLPNSYKLQIDSTPLFSQVQTTMTVTYAEKVACVSKIGSFRRVITIYSGSVYKLTKFDLLLYLILYSLISVVYRFVLPENVKGYFESFVMYCNVHYGKIPLTFILAFYMSTVVQRWWETWKAIPWPDGLALKLNNYFPNYPGREDECMRIKRTIMRYVNLSITETFRMISSPVKKRFPTYQHLIDAGLMTNTEMEAIANAQKQSEYMNTFYWLPMNWSANLVMNAEKERIICNPNYLVEILSEINKIRGMNGNLLAYDWINIPIIYTQLVTIAVYSYFATALFGRQTLDISAAGKTILGYENIGGIFNIIPLYLMLEFLFYVGWLKAAEVLINPYGEDDDDFETNYMIDRNLQICYLFVDQVSPPEVEKDPHWNIGIPKELPHTIASLPFRKPNLETAAENLTIPIDQHETIAPEDMKNFRKPSAIRKLSNLRMRWDTEMGLSNIVTLAASPMIKRKQRFSDSECIYRKDPKVRISTISSPKLEHKQSIIKVENEKKLSFNKNACYVVNRARKKGLSSEQTVRKLSHLLWDNDLPQTSKSNTNDSFIEECHDINKNKAQMMESKEHHHISKAEHNISEENADISEAGKCQGSTENLKTNKTEARIEVLHHGNLDTPTIKLLSVKSLHTE